MTRVVIVDYGLGNLASVAGAVAHAGHEPRVTSEPEEVAAAERVILPGVGAFGDGMARLRERDLIGALNRVAIERARPVLGICLGGQLMARSSEEFGEHAGLGWLPARIVRLVLRDPTLRVPHTGWNDVRKTGISPLLEGVDDGSVYYFNHGFRFDVSDPRIVAAECDYGGAFPCLLQHGNLIATLFHPEKSQRCGLTVLANFLKMTSPDPSDTDAAAPPDHDAHVP